LNNSVIPQQELGKIESENWSLVDKMTEEERRKSIEELKAQLPPGFLDRLNLNRKAEQEIPKEL
jgi:hypothetical protein